MRVCTHGVYDDVVHKCALVRSEKLVDDVYIFQQVRKIVLNFNSIEDRLSVDAWSNLGDILHELYLGDCRLKSLPAGMFDNMQQLRYLHLWKNQISVIPSLFFQVIVLCVAVILLLSLLPCNNVVCAGFTACSVFIARRPAVIRNVNIPMVN